MKINKERAPVYNSILTPHYLRGSMFLQGDICLHCFCQPTFEPRHEKKKTKSPEYPANTQISLGIRLVWSDFAVRMKKHWVLSFQHSITWLHKPEGRFSYDVAQMCQKGYKRWSKIYIAK